MWSRSPRRASGAIAISACTFLFPFVDAPAVPGQQAPMLAQRPAPPTDVVDSLITLALAANPMVATAGARVDAALARVGPAGARPDPVLSAGIQNLPLGSEAPMSVPAGTAPTHGPDPMTMRTIGLSQRFPFPGKLALQQRAAQRQVDAAKAMLLTARLDVARQVRDAYYDVAFADQSLILVARQRDVLAGIVRVTAARYTAGASAQRDVLAARVRAAQLGDQASELIERRRAALAVLNGLLNQKSDTPLGPASIPERVAATAVADSASAIHFAAQSLGARVANSPLLPLDSIQQLAIDNSPMLREHEARIAAQSARVALAEKATRPDFDVSVQYGQRNGLTDMLTAQVSIPIPIQHLRNQDLDVAAARDELVALHAEHQAQVNDLRARTAGLVSDLERDRTQLAIDVKAVLPQGQGMVSAATAAYDAGRGDLVAVLDARSTLLNYEFEYAKSLTDFAKKLAELQEVAGSDVLQEAAP